MVEVTQADRDAAEAIYPAFLASLKGEDGGYGLAEAFARHRTTSLAAHDGLVDALRVIAVGECRMNGIRAELSADVLRKIARAALASIEAKP